MHYLIKSTRCDHGRNIDQGCDDMEQYEFPIEQRLMLESLPQPLAVYQFVDNRVVTLIISDGFLDLFGYTDRTLAYHDMNHDLHKYEHPDDAVRVEKAARQFATQSGTFDILYRTKSRTSSDYRIIHANGKHIYPCEGVQLGYVWYINEGTYNETDTTEEDAFRRSVTNALHEESIIKESRYDVLTGLPSMTWFFQLAETAKNNYKAEGHEGVLLYFDLNGMKYFNTRHSFAEGDKLLKTFGALLLRTFGIDASCRIGADHFAAYTTEDDIEKKLTRLLSETAKLNSGNSLPVRVGIYSTRVEDVPVSIACDRAKIACDHLRSNYESCFNYYDQTMQNQAEQRQYILSHLDQAIREKWIQVYYQPIIRTVTGNVADDEALARWIDPVKGILNPAEFIPYLEEARVIYKLDLFVVEQVLEKIKIQQKAGIHPARQSINLSRSDFDSCDIVEEIRTRVDTANIPRSQIVIEITESVIGSNFDFMKKQVDRFRELGFPVWMDDFGSGYSSLDVLQSIRFDLIKFDMSFMKRLNQGDSGRIILTQLIKMASALGLDTACEGVETLEQLHFLKEIGCSKLQGYYFSRPVPLQTIMERYTDGSFPHPYENQEERTYYESISRVNLYDLAIISNEDTDAFRNYFNTIPMGIIEVKHNTVKYIRSNHAYRQFMHRYFGFNLSQDDPGFQGYDYGAGNPFMKIVQQSITTGTRLFFDEIMPDGTTVHSFIRPISTNPVTQKTAIAVAVLSITDLKEGTTYANIARALAADYYNIYYVNLDTEQFIEYTSPVGGEDLAIERHGENFFESARHDTNIRIYQEDRAPFLTGFTKENILKELDKQGVYTATYRLIDSGTPMYVNMKIMRTQPDQKHLIIGISVIDSQMKQQELTDKLQMEKNAYDRIMALTGDYLSLYTIDPQNNTYIEYSLSEDYKTLNLPKQGTDFFAEGLTRAPSALHPDDLPQFLSSFTKQNILQAIAQTGQYTLHYRLMLRGVPKKVSLKIVSIKEKDQEKLIAGIRAWRERR